MSEWTKRDMPSQAGRLAIVTGANSGVGFEAAKALAERGAEVILAVRRPDAGQAAAERIRAAAPEAVARVEPLDLASQVSVAAFTDRRLREGRPIDILLNNAGVMAIPRRRLSPDGHELQMATNYLGHFALTARLSPLLTAGRARTVQLSSVAHRWVRPDWSDLNAERGYKAWEVYGRTKLAMLMFALELDRRSRASGWGVTSVAAHPGFARTELIANGPARRPGGRAVSKLIEVASGFVSHSAESGARPLLMAATTDTAGGAYFGPQNLREHRGPPGAARIEPYAEDAASARALWDATERLLDLRFS